MRNSKRNIGIIAHVDAGKTTTTERILFYTGENHRIGEVHNGNTTMDFDVQERKRGITIQSAATTVFWRDHQINLIDTPGHIDFNIEVNRSLRVLDGAVVLFDGVAGVEPQTETNWRLADQYRVARIGLINKLDRVGADFYRAVEAIRERLGIEPLVLHLPIGAEESFRGVVDVVAQRALLWEEGEMRCRVADIPSDLQQAAVRYRERLIETLADRDERILEAYLNGEVPAVQTLRAAIAEGTQCGAWLPLLAGSAFKNKGIEPLLDAIVDYLPPPEAAPGTLAALAFKVANGDHGPLTFVRVYRGSMRPGDVVLNANTGKKERIARLYEIHADKTLERDRAEAGDIVGIAGLKESLTGHTLCAPEQPLVLEQISLPEPMIDVAVHARTLADQQSLAKALHALLREDPSLRVRQDRESGQLILSAMGELQIEVTLEKLRLAHGVEATVGRPQVAYRETVTTAASVHHVLRKQSGGPGQFAELRLRVAPLARGSGIRFESEIVGGAIPREYIPAVETGVRKAAETGVVAGYAMVDCEVVLVDGAYHANDSSTLAFEQAAMAAFRQAVLQAGPVLLEPVMAVEVVAPSENLGDCIGDLSRRRGSIRAQEQRNRSMLIVAHVPLREMFGYIGTLRTLTAGRAHYSMRFERYDLAPAHIVDQG